MKNLLKDYCETKLTCIKKKNSTKEKILEAAFNLYKKPRFKDITLQEVADSCGITKAAIFRHYKGKDNLIQAMNSRFVDVTCPFLEQMNGLENFTEIFEKIFSYFVQHFEYLAFFMTELLRPGEFENRLFQEFKKRNIHLEYEIFDENVIVKNKDIYVKIIYAFVSVLFISFSQVHSYFITVDETEYPNVKTISQEKIHEISESIYHLLKHGTKKIEQISETRKTELENIVLISDEDLPEENKIFSALAFVIHNYGFPGVTVERIASELGLAKSSLYTYFSDKSTMMKKLISDEMVQMINFINLKTSLGKTYSEKIYIQMFSQLEYFTHRKSLLPVMSWISLQENMDIKNSHGKNNSLKKFIKEKVHKVEGTLSLEDKNVIWISMLQIALMVQGRKHGFKVFELKMYLRKMFEMITNGINI